MTPNGLHHVTAIAGDAQANLDVYAGLLGLRLVKRTVNFDDPGTYHLYYGDETGRPGTIMTFFPWKGAGRGTLGAGQIAATAFSIPQGSIGYWHDRLRGAHLPAEEPRSRFDQEVLAFADPDGLRLELVADPAADAMAPWHGGPVPEIHAIRSFHGITLLERSLDETASVLTEHLGYTPGETSGARHRFVAADSPFAGRLDVLVQPELGDGRVAVGSVHHAAFRIDDDEAQDGWRASAVAAGLHVTPRQDRNYFHSLYFREPGGVLFEIATDPPGFTVDEPVEELGRSLRLPQWLEGQRERIEGLLPTLDAPQRSEVLA